MDAFTVHTGRAAALRRSNVDTDQIIPSDYLKRVTRTGFEDGLFAAWRANGDFVLDRPEHAGVTILLTGPDFGTGSSREHAVWALQDFGFRAVVSPRFGDIFRSNALKSGLLPVVIPEPEVDALMDLVEADPSAAVTVDLEALEVRAADLIVPFPLEESARRRLLAGLDDIALTLSHEVDIRVFEGRRPAWRPSIEAPVGG
jgi:3-isopropylmalate/(R)-2-methylmalate dehydratase small subunit